MQKKQIGLLLVACIGIILLRETMGPTVERVYGEV
jgi:hypothetical protein